jgi:nitronate monooxygenase
VARRRRRLLSELGVDLPVLAAPMAGGPGGPELVIAAAQAGGLGFIAGGYKQPEVFATELARAQDADVPSAVNLFAPNPLPADAAELRRYAERIRPDAESLGISLDVQRPREDDDWWHEKLELLLAAPVALVSFTFGIPTTAAIRALQAGGTLVVQSVTSVEEALAAEAAGVDGLAVQSSQAGGHWGTLTPREPPPQLPLTELVASVATAVELPLIGAGGLGTPGAVRAVLAAGADAAMVGTALLLATESATTQPHRAALRDEARTETVLTRAFTGRPARGLRNGFIDRHDANAPFGYPAIHHLTAPLRRAAAAADEPELLHLWAGAAWRAAREAPAAEILRGLAP